MCETTLSSKSDEFDFDEEAGASVLIITRYVDCHNNTYLPLAISSGFANPCWKIHGGHVEQGESITAAARRELREELGIIPDKFIHKKEWCIEKESKGRQTTAKHKQFVFIAITTSMAGYIDGCIDGNKVLKNKVFPLEKVKDVVTKNITLDGYRILSGHKEVLRKAFEVENFGL